MGPIESQFLKRWQTAKQRLNKGGGKDDQPISRSRVVHVRSNGWPPRRIKLPMVSLADMDGCIRMIEGRAKTILAECVEKHDLPAREILGPWRARELVWARQELAYRLRAETPMSYPQIGLFIGGRDHTTILYSVRQHAKRNGLQVPGERW